MGSRVVPHRLRAFTRRREAIPRIGERATLSHSVFRSVSEMTLLVTPAETAKSIRYRELATVSWDSEISVLAADSGHPNQMIAVGFADGSCCVVDPQMS